MEHEQLNDENGWLREENRRLSDTVEYLRAEASRLQGDHLLLHALQVQVGLGPIEEPEADGGSERINLLEYSRHPRELREALSQGSHLAECRLALQNANRHSGAPFRCQDVRAPAPVR